MGSTAATDIMIRLDDVTKVFPGGTRPAVEGLSLDVARGEFVTLVGPSGCGKTTTLKMINRIIEPTSGRIFIDGQDALAVPAYELRRSIGYVIQQIGLFPHRTVAQNIATVPMLLDWDRGRIDARVAELVEIVGLEPAMLTRYPSELSGGQQQRVGVARALAADPPVLLMDEPFGAVDPIVRKRLQQEFRHLQERLGKTVVFVTHDIDEAVFMGTRTAILNVGGVLEQFDTPETILANPANAFVEDFLGGERGLKRLALRPVSKVGIERGPVVDVSADIDEARRVMNDHSVDWLGLLEGDRLLGWVNASQLDGGDLRLLEPRPFLVSLDSQSSLREALDAVVTSHARIAVVVDDGVYRGMLDLESIAEEITE
ncbi:MAG: ATP-binding cassette domain-containing protein [Actinomycetota bacterium]|nr:ATP-binding cassette domain-containing protein [Actinomycetota bacterium]